MTNILIHILFLISLAIFLFINSLYFIKIKQLSSYFKVNYNISLRRFNKLHYHYSYLNNIYQLSGFITKTLDNKYNFALDLFHIRLRSLIYPNFHQVTQMVESVMHNPEYLDKPLNEKHLLSVVEKGIITKLNKEHISTFQLQFNIIHMISIGLSFSFISYYLYHFSIIDLSFTLTSTLINVSLLALCVFNILSIKVYSDFMDKLIRWSRFLYHSPSVQGMRDFILRFLDKEDVDKQHLSFLEIIVDNYYEIDYEDREWIQNQLEDLIEFIYFYTITDKKDKESIIKYVRKINNNVRTYMNKGNYDMLEEVESLYSLRQQDYEFKYQEKIAEA